MDTFIPSELTVISDKQISNIENGKKFVNRKLPRLFDLFRRRKITTVNYNTPFVKDYWEGVK